MARRRAQRAARTFGIVPKVAVAFWRGTVWLVRHPQPLILAAVIVGLGASLQSYLPASEAFRVTTVHVTPPGAIDIPQDLLGQNLWTIDVDRLAWDLSLKQPGIKHVQVTRVLPDTLRVDVATRAPRVQVRLGRWYPVDEDGYVLPVGREAASEELIEVKGLEQAKEPVNVGKVNTGERLQLALRVASTLDQSAALEGHRVRRLDVSNPQQISFVIGEEVEIRCGSERELAEHLERLRAVFRTAVQQPADVRYIDLRFNEPVVSPRMVDIG